MGDVIVDVVALLAGVAVIVWGAETFAEHLASAAARLGVTSFALALRWPAPSPRSWPPRSRPRCGTHPRSRSAM